MFKGLLTSILAISVVLSAVLNTQSFARFDGQYVGEATLSESHDSSGSDYSEENGVDVTQLTDLDSLDDLDDAELQVSHVWGLALIAIGSVTERPHSLSTWILHDLHRPPRA